MLLDEGSFWPTSAGFIDSLYLLSKPDRQMVLAIIWLAAFRGDFGCSLLAGVSEICGTFDMSRCNRSRLVELEQPSTSGHARAYPWNMPSVFSWYHRTDSGVPHSALL